MVRDRLHVGFGQCLENALIGLSVVTGLADSVWAGELHDAVRAGDTVAVEQLLSGGADTGQSDFVLGTPLHIAIAQGDADVALLLINSGADLEVPSELQGALALHLAAELGEVSIVEALLDHGAQVNSEDANGATPLVRAATTGQVGAVRALLDKGGEPA